jgi:glyoxylase-like metal-dependent hydrolase (beta-lactamase superfamily II)
VIALDLRPGPSANLALVDDVLIDSGDGSPASIARTRAFLAAHRAEPRWLALTHFHADHAGGAAALGLPVAAHAVEAELINGGDPRAGDTWLGFDIPPYRVTRALADG